MSEGNKKEAYGARPGKVRFPRRESSGAEDDSKRGRRIVVDASGWGGGSIEAKLSE